MKYVNIIRRIAMIDKALHRLWNDDHDERYEDRYDEIEDRLWDKRKMLSQSLKEFTSCPDRTNKELRRHYSGHRKQVKLACKLLGVDYYKVIRGY